MSPFLPTRFWNPTLAVAILVFSITGCAVSSVAPITFPARYRPEGSASAVKVAPACATFRSLTFTDEREEGPAGSRSIQDRPGQSEIFLGGDVAAWFRAASDRALGFAHLRESSDAGFGLILKLVAVRVDEVAYRNSTFVGRVVVDVDLRAPGSNTVSWTKRFDGTAENYGRPGKHANYQETLNHALDRALAELVNDQTLLDQLCGSRAAVLSKPPTASHSAS